MDARKVVARVGPRPLVKNISIGWPFFFSPFRNYFKNSEISWMRSYTKM